MPLFSALKASDVIPVKEDAVYRAASSPWAGRDASWLGVGRFAVIVDLPGPDAVEVGLGLGHLGFRPVLAINATSAEREVIDMEPVLAMIAEGARFRSSFSAPKDAPPAFILDARREGPESKPAPGKFDNRWTVFPTDLPSPEHLKSEQIDAVVIIAEGMLVKDDILAVAWTYEREGVEVRVANVNGHTLGALPSARPGWFSFTVGHIRRRFAFRRRWDGSYGHRVPIPPEPSHG